MTKLQKQKIKNLDSENMALRKSIKHYKTKALRLESKKEKNKRGINGINELKRRGVMQ